MHKKAAMLEDRGVVSVSGADATSFLQGLLTNDVERLHPSEARYAALLTPQGKILFDMIVVRAPGGEEPSYLIDCAAAQAADLAKRLGFYKLRAKVAIADLSADRAVAAFWGAEPAVAEGVLYADPRDPRLGWRAILPRPAAATVGSEHLGEYEGSSDRRRSAQGRPRFRLCGRLPARRQFRSSSWCRFRQGLLCRPGGRLPDEASRNRPQARRARQTRRPGPGAWDADHGRRARGRRARLLLGTRGAGALETRPR